MQDSFFELSLEDRMRELKKRIRTYNRRNGCPIEWCYEYVELENKISSNRANSSRKGL